MTSQEEEPNPQIALVIDVVTTSIDRAAIAAELQGRSASGEDELVLPRSRVDADLLDDVVHVIDGLESDRSERIERFIARYPGTGRHGDDRPRRDEDGP